MRAGWTSATIGAVIAGTALAGFGQTKPVENTNDGPFIDGENFVVSSRSSSLRVYGAVRGFVGSFMRA